MALLRKVWQSWKRVGQIIGDTIARVFLTVFYFTMFMPFGLGVRFFGDPLTIRPRGHVKWLERTAHGQTLDDSRRLF